MKRDYISFYIVLGLFLILTIVLFIIMLNLNSTITSQLNQQVSLFVASMDIRNINSLLSSKAEDYYDLELPLIDLLIASNFFDDNLEIREILKSAKYKYSSQYNIEFGYCTKTGCEGSCKGLYLFPTAYSDLAICSPEFLVTFGYDSECGESK